MIVWIGKYSASFGLRPEDCFAFHYHPGPPVSVPIKRADKVSVQAP
ncbi:MAG: hypothetical protein FWD57_15430 [Polyangiaceae bacterium]|nr:hypothetical protein [Polyangiaceae bacterium]